MHSVSVHIVHILKKVCTVLTRHKLSWIGESNVRLRHVQLHCDHCTGIYLQICQGWGCIIHSCLADFLPVPSPPIILKNILSLIMFPTSEIIFPLIRWGNFFLDRCFLPGYFVPTDVLSRRSFCCRMFLSLRMFCPSRCFVPPDVLSLQMLFPLDVLSLRTLFPVDVLSPDVLSGHLKMQQAHAALI